MRWRDLEPGDVVMDLIDATWVVLRSSAEDGIIVWLRLDTGSVRTDHEAWHRKKTIGPGFKVLRGGEELRG